MEQRSERSIYEIQITNHETMTYLKKTKKQTILRTEASLHSGLSTSLFQKGQRGQLFILVHFTNRSLTETEKRYRQTEKDELAVKWTLDILRNYLIGIPKFIIVTGHKPFIPMFNKAIAKLSPCVEKWINFKWGLG